MTTTVKQFTQYLDLELKGLSERNLKRLLESWDIDPNNIAEGLKTIKAQLIAQFESWPDYLDYLKDEVTIDVRIDENSASPHRILSFSRCALRRVDLSDVDLRNVNLSNADLSDADLSGADLRNANLRDANLKHAIFNNAIMTDADLRGASLDDVQLVGTDLRGALGLTLSDGYQCTYVGEGVIIGHSGSATRLPDSSLLDDFSVLVPNDGQERTGNPLLDVEAWFEERKREASARGSTFINITPTQWQPDSRDRKPLTIYIRPDHFELFCEQVISDIQSLKEREVETAQAEIAKNVGGQSMGQ